MSSLVCDLRMDRSCAWWWWGKTCERGGVRVLRANLRRGGGEVGSRGQIFRFGEGSAQCTHKSSRQAVLNSQQRGQTGGTQMPAVTLAAPYPSPSFQFVARPLLVPSDPCQNHHACLPGHCHVGSPVVSILDVIPVKRPDSYRSLRPDPCVRFAPCPTVSHTVVHTRLTRAPSQRRPGSRSPCCPALTSTCPPACPHTHPHIRPVVLCVRSYQEHGDLGVLHVKLMRCWAGRGKRVGGGPAGPRVLEEDLIQRRKEQVS